MTNLDSLLKSRDITFWTKVHIGKAMVFPVVIYGCESWTMCECPRTDVFKLWYWRRLLRVPWTAERSNQSILREINSEYLLEVLKLNLEYFGHPMRRSDSLEETLMLGKVEGTKRTTEDEMVDSITDSVHMTLNKLGDSEGQESLACYNPWGCKELNTTNQQNHSNGRK